jgi:cobalt/nickel transport system permease protein
MKNTMTNNILVALFCCTILFSADAAWAMHISEGILPLRWAVLWFIIAAPFVAYGLYSLKKRAVEDLSFKPLVGLMAAVVFTR